MNTCHKCGKDIPSREKYNGRWVTLNHRKYCTTCNPISERRIWLGKETCRIRNGSGVKLIRDDKTSQCITCSRTFTIKTNNRECSSCRSAKRRRQHKQKAIEMFGGGCKVCGYNRCSRALVFHHVDATQKEMNISYHWEKPWEILEKELKKCVLVCNRCHEEIHEGIVKI